MRSAAQQNNLPAVALVAHDIHDQGGMERVCAQLIRHSHAEFRFTIIAAELAPELRPLVERWIRIRAPRRPFPLKFVWFFFSAGRALQRSQFDLVHTVGAIVPNRVDLATIHFCHAGFRAAQTKCDTAPVPWSRRLNTRLARLVAISAERWAYRPDRLRATGAVSSGVQKELILHYPGIPSHLTPNGVDAARFRPDAQGRADVRLRQVISPETCLALFVGGDWGRKGLNLAIEGLAKARAKGADIHLWVIGRGDQDRFSALAQNLGVDAATTFLGTQTDMERYYNAADVFLFPSAYEAFPLVCLEAAACGLPLIIPPISGADVLVGDDEAGILIERSAGSIATALGTLSRDGRLRLSLGAQARSRACRFTWHAAAEATVAIYRELLPERDA